MKSILEKEYICPHCGVPSGGKDWTYYEPYCEDCGNHNGVICPKCNEGVDSVYYDDFDYLTWKLYN